MSSNEDAPELESRSDEVKSNGSQIAKALAAAQAEFPSIPKNKVAKVRTKTGVEYSYHYADLADILKAVLPVLATHGIAFIQPIRLSADGKFMRLVTCLLHESGEIIQSDGIPLYEGSSPQDFGTQLTYARRYDGSSTLGISPDEDEDANLSSGKDAEISDKHRPERRPTAEVKRDQYIKDKTGRLQAEIDEARMGKSQGTKIRDQVEAYVKDKGDEPGAKAKLKQQLEASLEDMGEAHAMQPEPQPQPKDPGLISDAQKAMIFTIAKKRGLSEADVFDILGSFGFEHLSEMPRSKVSVFLDEMDPDFRFHHKQAN